MDNNNQTTPSQIVPRVITQVQIPPGGILPRHLAASTTMKAGDIYYVGTNGIFVRLPIGTSGQSLKVSASGIPYWG